MAKWIDLNDRTSGGKLKVAQIEGRTFLYVVGMSNQSPRWTAAIEKLGFTAGGNGRFLVRQVVAGERTTAKQFHEVWPNAVLVEMDPKEFLLDLSMGKRQRKESTDEERSLANLTAGAARLGRNADGDEVYQGPLGRFILRERFGATYESENLRPAMLLRAPDEESLALCAAGFVQSMVQGEVQHTEDFMRFVKAVSSLPLDTHDAELDLGRLTAARTAIGAAVLKHLRQEFDTPQDAYGESVRLYELLPPHHGQARGAGAMPQPLSVLAQRLLGDTSGKLVSVPNAFDGASFAFLPAGTNVRAFKGRRDLSAMVPRGVQANVEWRDEFVASREIGAEAIFFNADPVRGSDGRRQDYREALTALQTLAVDGRAVLVVAGDDPRHPGVLSVESERFMQSLADRYEIEEAFELGAQLTQRVGTNRSLRLIAVRNRAPLEPQRITDLPAVHSWDEVKSRVDETLVRAKVKEADSEGIDVERAARVNRFQSPYIAFSQVSESRTMVPKNLQAPLQAALADVEAVHGPVDRFVEAELGFGENTLGERFSAEQVDAMALSFARMKRGRASILADETGIGKGRTLGGQATWAAKQGKLVVFMTDRANLFSDLARDLRDIGEWGRFRPLITNTDGRIVDNIGDAGVLAEGVSPDAMNRILEENTSAADLGVNIVFSTYSQISGENSPKAQWIKNQLPNALLIVDEAHIAAGSDSTTARQISEMTGLAWNVVFSSATWAKSARNLHIFARAFPETVNIASLTETMKRGGEGFAEVFSSMLARDGALIRREHDLSRLEFVLEVDAPNLERNRAVADQVAALMGSLSYTAGTLNKLMIRLSQASLDALREAREVRQGANTADIFKSAFGAGSLLYQVQRRMNAALNADNAIRLATRALEEGRKPVIVFDDTGESFLKRTIDERMLYDLKGRPIRPEMVPVPTIRDLLHKAVADLESVKVTQVDADELEEADREGRNLAGEMGEEEGVDAAALAQGAQPAGEEPAGDLPPPEDSGEGAAPRRPARKVKKVRRIPFGELPNLTDDQRRAYQDGMAELRRMIDGLPPLSLSVADEIHNRLRAAGVRTGEISGRSFMLERDPTSTDGMARLVNRPKNKAFVNATVRAFNSGEIDAALLNRSAATGISMHASPRFIDQRRRELIEIQAAENPNDRIQLFGRVNRFDQLSFPRVSIGSTGIPGELRQLMMNNRKLAELSANVRSSRETHAVVSDVVDLLNPIGREVCRQFFLDNPSYVTRMGLNLKQIEDNQVDAANLFSQRVALLRIAEQEHVYQQVTSLFDEAVLKAELSGENPLKPKEMDIRARAVSSHVVFGIEHGGLGSAFDGPVHAKALVYEEKCNPMDWVAIEEAIAAARTNLMASGRAQQVGTMIDERRTPIIEINALAQKTAVQLDALARTALVATTFTNTEEAMASPVPNPVRRAMIRKIWIEENLPKLVPGARISMPHPNKHFVGAQVPGIVVDLIPPPDKRESQLAQWKVMILQPGQERPVAHSLNSFLSNVQGMQLPGERLTTLADVVVGDDVLLNPSTPRNTVLRNAFENIFRGTRRRHAAMLTGNMFLASEFAAQSKVGHGVIWTDERGLRHRGVLLNRQFNAASLRHMPVRVWISRAIERFMLEVTGLSDERVQRTEDGTELPGIPACAPNTRGGYLMHTSFHGAWTYASGGGFSTDTLMVVPGEGIMLMPGKDSGRRLATQLRAAQRRIRSTEIQEIASRMPAQQTPEQGEQQNEGEGAEHAPDQAEAAPAQAQPEAAGGRRRRRRAEPADADPNAVSVSQAGSKKGIAPIMLKARTPGQVRRAVRMLLDGGGLQLFVSPHVELGQLAKRVVHDDLVQRLRAEIGDDPVRLAKLEEQLARVDGSGEAAVDDEVLQEALRDSTDDGDQSLLEFVGGAPGADVEGAAEAAAAVAEMVAGGVAAAGPAGGEGEDDEEPDAPTERMAA